MYDFENDLEGFKREIIAEQSSSF